MRSRPAIPRQGWTTRSNRRRISPRIPSVGCVSNNFWKLRATFNIERVERAATRPFFIPASRFWYFVGSFFRAKPTKNLITAMLREPSLAGPVIVPTPDGIPQCEIPRFVDAPATITTRGRRYSSLLPAIREYTNFHAHRNDPNSANSMMR